MPTRAYVTVEDYSQEKSTVSFWVQDMSGLNYDSVAQDVDEVKDAILALTLGAVRVAGITKEFPESGADVTDPNAQRERKALIVYQDQTQFLDAGNTIANPGYLKLFTLELPAAKVEDGSGTSYLKEDSDEYDLANADIAAFIAVIEANVRSPYNNSAQAPAIKVVKMTKVGRRT